MLTIQEFILAAIFAVLATGTYQKMNFVRSTIVASFGFVFLIGPKLAHAEKIEIGNWEARITSKSFSASTVDLDKRWYLNYHCDKDIELITITNRRADEGYGADYLLLLTDNGQLRQFMPTDYYVNDRSIYLSDNKDMKEDLWSDENMSLHFFWLNKENHSQSASFKLMGAKSWKKMAVEICALTPETPSR